MATKTIEKGESEKDTLAKEMPVSSDMLELLKVFAVENKLKTGQIRRIFRPEVASKIEVPENSVPMGIFANKKLGAFEAIAKYLRENLDYSFTKIAGLTKRSSKTIWATYNNAAKKMPEKFSLEILPLYAPLSILENRNLGVQEALVKYLKEDIGLNYHKIAVLLNRNDRTIWTVYNRTRKKFRGGRKK